MVGDADVAYRVVGDGPVDLVYFYGLGTHVDTHTDDPRIGQLQDALGSFSRLIFFDRRGPGASDGLARNAKVGCAGAGLPLAELYELEPEDVHMRKVLGVPRHLGARSAPHQRRAAPCRRQSSGSRRVPEPLRVLRRAPRRCRDRVVAVTTGWPKLWGPGVSAYPETPGPGRLQRGERCLARH